MALSSTIYTFDIELSDVDRHVYQTLNLKVARHPSETEEFLLTRVLAYCLEYAEGIGFSRGVSEPDEPAVAVRDLTGAWVAWIDVGAPDAARLHKAAKLAPRVIVYTHRDPAALARQLSGERIHRAGDIELYGIEREFLGALVARLERRTSFTISVADRHLYLTIGEATLSMALERTPLRTD
ncbi:MAG TPA: YaeQ family protein [Gemmatimonadales bacterium]|nr:YaeQ family protein [Gemmatimonadales bacterium]